MDFLTKARRRLLTSQMMAPRAQLMLPALFRKHFIQTRMGFNLGALREAGRQKTMEE